MTPPSLPFRIGHGFDLHRLEPGRSLVIGGLTIEHDRGPAAHSDGDVVYHAVTDALLGAIAGPDIGQLFPDTDPQWNATDSTVFLTEAARRIAAAGYRLGNLDVTVILQQPKLGPHKDAIRHNLVSALDCELHQVNLKAKTHERVDAIGRQQAIACHAVALLTRSGPDPT